ncbi:hypothetical protein OIV83_005327 [Microbotryomycetes sp. JL201]|nr:hypothetical protein OIV83_005327 [Microbotryomycetes sp. JL201]
MAARTRDLLSRETLLALLDASHADLQGQQWQQARAMGRQYAQLARQTTVHSPDATAAESCMHSVVKRTCLDRYANLVTLESFNARSSADSADADTLEQCRRLLTTAQKFVDDYSGK